MNYVAGEVTSKEQSKIIVTRKIGEIGKRQNFLMVAKRWVLKKQDIRKPETINTSANEQASNLCAAYNHATIVKLEGKQIVSNPQNQEICRSQ